MSQIKVESIAERMGSATAPEDVEIIENSRMAEVTRALDDAMARKSGHPLFNPRGARLKDFNMQYFRVRYQVVAGNTGLLCLFIHKATAQEMVSSVDLWPRSDFWVIVCELSRLG